jgi:HEAT repeat protein
VPALLEALEDNAPEVQIAVMETLVSIGPKAHTAIPQIMGLLAHADTSIRAKAAESLGRMKSDDPQVIAALTERLEDEALSVAVFAAESLRRIDPKSTEAVPVLVAVLESEDEAARAQAADALFAFGVMRSPPCRNSSRLWQPNRPRSAQVRPKRSPAWEAKLNWPSTR